jgi:hypothetical protein
MGTGNEGTELLSLALRTPENKTLIHYYLLCFVFVEVFNLIILISLTPAAFFK